jgi:transposase InsO family protein
MAPQQETAGHATPPGAHFSRRTPQERNELLPPPRPAWKAEGEARQTQRLAELQAPRRKEELCRRRITQSMRTARHRAPFGYAEARS